VVPERLFNRADRENPALTTSRDQQGKRNCPAFVPEIHRFCSIVGQDGSLAGRRCADKGLQSPQIVTLPAIAGLHLYGNAVAAHRNDEVHLMAPLHVPETEFRALQMGIYDASQVLASVKNSLGNLISRLDRFAR
jgi:hypothetical protein